MDPKLNPVITPHKTWYFYIVAILAVSSFPAVTWKVNARENEVDRLLWWDWVMGREISVEIVGSRLGKFEGFWGQVLHSFQASWIAEESRLAKSVDINASTKPQL
jgi:hypothetical protein